MSGAPESSAAPVAVEKSEPAAARALAVRAPGVLGPVTGRRAVGRAAGGDAVGPSRGPLSVALSAARSLSGRLPYALAAVTRGACAGCSLGAHGLQDAVLDGTHLCAQRLTGLARSAPPAMIPADLLDVRGWHVRGPDALAAMGRLTHPYVRHAGARGFTRVTWSAAGALVRERCKNTPAHRVAMLASARDQPVESHYAFAKMARLLGTGALDLLGPGDPAAAASALEDTLGVGAATVGLEQLLSAELVLLVGDGPVDSHPGLARLIAVARASGARVAHVSPRADAGLLSARVGRGGGPSIFPTALVDDEVRVSVGGEAAALRGVLCALSDRGAIDARWVDTHVAGGTDGLAALTAAGLDVEAADAGCGPRELQWVGELVSRARRVVTVFLPGDAPAPLVGAVVALHASRGLLGRVGCGVVPLWAGGATQGALDVGLRPDRLAGGRARDAAGAAALAEDWQMPSLDLGPAMSRAQILAPSAEARFDLLYLLGGGPPADVALTAPFRVHQGSLPHPSMFAPPTATVLLLPELPRHSLPDGSLHTSTDRRVRFSPHIPGLPELHDARPGWAIPGLVLGALRPELSGAVRWPDGASLRVEIEQVVRAYAGIAALGARGDWVQWGGPLLCGGGHCDGLPGGRIHLNGAVAGG